MALRKIGRPENAVAITGSVYEDESTGEKWQLSKAAESLEAALAIIGTVGTIWLDKAVAVDDDLTVPAGVTLVAMPGASVVVASGKTLTFNGTVVSFVKDYTAVFTGDGTTTFGAAAEALQSAVIA